MQALNPLPDTRELAGAWCNGDALASAAIEAISFVTPALERFFIRTVADALPLGGDPALESACRAFIRDEAAHTCAHRQFNAALLTHLPTPPPGLAGIEKLLDLTNRHLALPNRIALVAALEHGTAVVSKFWLDGQTRWRFDCAFARDLFLYHAREEIAHRSVAFDLWQHRGGGNLPARVIALAAILLAGGAYLGVAAPAILYRKRQRRLLDSLAAIAALRVTAVGALLKALLRYAHPAYHPRHLVDDAAPASSQLS
jgi:predicted metal-dependent hydrolase